MFAVTSSTTQWVRTLFVSAALIAVPVMAWADASTKDTARSTSGDIVVSTNGNCVRTMWPSNEDECAGTQKMTLTLQDLTVYFDTASSRISEQGKATLNKLAQVLLSDKQVKDATIVGYADRMGSNQYNDALSQRRAKAVRDYLTSQGFVKTQIAETRWFGETRPATDCPATLSRSALIECLQKDRRVEVEVSYLPTTTKAAR